MLLNSLWSLLLSRVMNSSSASMGDNPVPPVTDEFNARSHSRGPEHEHHQRREGNLEAIHDHNANQSPRSTNAFSEPWEESPTSRGLLQGRNSTAVFERSAIATSNLFHRPSSAGGIHPPTTFCFQPSHMPKPFQLGRHAVKPAQKVALKEKVVANEQVPFSTSDG